MSEGLTKKQEGFVKEYLETGNGTQSAFHHYDTDKESVAAVIASENLRKPKIREYLESQAENAALRIVELSVSAVNETVRLNANKDILDRAGYKPVERADVTSGGDKVGSSPVLAEVIAEADRILKEKKLNG